MNTNTPNHGQVPRYKVTGKRTPSLPDRKWLLDNICLLDGLHVFSIFADSLLHISFLCVCLHGQKTTTDYFHVHVQICIHLCDV